MENSVQYRRREHSTVVLEQHPRPLVLVYGGDVLEPDLVGDEGLVLDAVHHLRQAPDHVISSELEDLIDHSMGIRTLTRFQ